MIETLIEIAREAGRATLAVYNDESLAADVKWKEDDSPLTRADEASHEIIIKRLGESFPDIPVLSEEGSDHNTYETRREWPEYFLVDPLDGTKEFINRNGEFTVNIALMKSNIPVMGVIYIPVKDIIYAGSPTGAKKIQGNESLDLSVVSRETNRVAVRSKSHASPEEEEVLERYEVSDFISVGSSIKFCMVAEGKADLYYRHGPTMEWDTAAGHAIVKAAGGQVYMGSTEETELPYNKKDLLNGSFLCVGFND